MDGDESSSTTSSDSLNLTWYTAKAEDSEDSDYEDAPAPEQPKASNLNGRLLSRDVLQRPNHRDSTFRN